MRVLHIFIEIKFSGAEIMYANAASLFQKKGVEMIALSTGNEKGDFTPRFEAENIKVYHKPLDLKEYNPFILVPYFYKLYKFVNKEKIEVIHIHRSKHYWWFSLIAFIARIKSVRTIHNVFKHRKVTWLKGFFERFTARKIFKLKFQTIGNSVYENEKYYYKNKTTLINNWYDNERFFPPNNDQEKSDVRLSLGLPTEVLSIISTGGCSDVKNHHDIIRAMATINKKINCIYIHLGHGEKEEEERKLAVKLGVDDKIYFLGNQKNVRDYLISSDIYIMPSRFEGLSIAAIEAMACELPSVLYNAPGLRDLIDNNDNGLLIEQNSNTLANAILELNNNQQLRKKMGDKAKRFVVQNFSVNNGVDGIMKLYSEK